jgi:sulfatase modifying factor 1
LSESGAKTVQAAPRAPGPPPPGMRWIPGGTFAMGSEDFYPEDWQGEFPWQNTKLDGYQGTSPVASFPPNGYGLFDMAGNVWEWTSDWFTPHAADVESPCCVPRNPRAASPESRPGESIPRRVIMGGSHLCAPSYCLRYRPAARQGQAIDSSTTHLGLRCVVRRAGEMRSATAATSRRALENGRA